MADRLSFDESLESLDKVTRALDAGDVDVDYAKAVANLAGKRLKHYAAKLEYERLRGTKRPIEWFEDAT